MKKSALGKKQVIEKLLMIPVLGPTSIDRKKPGSAIEKYFSAEEREILKTLTSEDFNHREEMMKPCPTPTNKSRSRRPK